MQSALLRPYVRVIHQTRANLTGSVLWTSLLIFLLTLSLARSTVTAQWVPGIEVIPFLALAGALVMGLLALVPLPWAVGFGIGLVLGPVLAAVAAGPMLQVHYHDQLSPGLVGIWWGRITDGSAVADTAFDLFLICWLMWVTGGWLSWCVLRWRQPLLGLVPGAAAFATNLLNFPNDQNGYVLAVLVLTLALLLWTNYTGAIANAVNAKVKLTGDARWDFWESGLVAMAALIVLAIMLPPLSTVDRTQDVSSSLFSSWAQLLQTVSHPALSGKGSGTGTTGFSTDVKLTGALTKTRNVVFTYTVNGQHTAPLYFRGVNETETLGGIWRYPNVVAFKELLSKGRVPNYGELYEKLGVVTVTLKMRAPPVGYTDLIFYPGQLHRVDRETVANEVFLPEGLPAALTTIDRLQSQSPRVSTGGYSVTTEFSVATEDQLRAAGTTYPDWLKPYMGLPARGYRPADVQARIKTLALKITAGAVTPYDKVLAIESYLRNSNIFKYTLKPKAIPAAYDPIDYFLFHSNEGYCEFFATAMGDMLRSIGIPTRLVNGFGPGLYESSFNSFVVRGEDAHTWVEAYFPQYGWITFEPTPDTQGGYFSITRGQGNTNCLRDFGCGEPPTGGGVTTGPGDKEEPPGPPLGTDAGGAGSGGFRIRIPDAGTLTRIFGVFLAIVLLLFAAVARYLRPRTVMGVWRRTLALSRLAGADRRAGETPYELGRRLVRYFPEASDPLRSLANGFVVAAYAPPDVARSTRASVMDAWSALRPHLLRRVFSRLRHRDL